jgi:hypothetical protein
MDGVGEEADTADGGDRRPRRLDGVREQDLPETLSLRRSDASGRVVLALLLLRHPCEPLIERRLTAAKASTDVLLVVPVYSSAGIRVQDLCQRFSCFVSLRI